MPDVHISQKRPQLLMDATQKDKNKGEKAKREMHKEDKDPKNRKGATEPMECMEKDKPESTIDENCCGPTLAADKCLKSESTDFWGFLTGVMERLPEGIEPPPVCVHRFCDNKKIDLGAALATAAWGRLREIELRCQGEFHRLDAAIGKMTQSLEQHEAEVNAFYLRVRVRSLIDSKSNGDMRVVLDTMQKEMREIATQLSELRGKHSKCQRRQEEHGGCNLGESLGNKVANLWDLQGMVNRAVQHQSEDSRLAALEKEVAELHARTKSSHGLNAALASCEEWSTTVEAPIWESDSDLAKGAPPATSGTVNGTSIQVETIGVPSQQQNHESENSLDIGGRSQGEVDSQHASHEAREEDASSRKQWRGTRTAKKRHGRGKGSDKRKPMASIEEREEELCTTNQTEEVDTEDQQQVMECWWSKRDYEGSASKPERWSDMIPN